MTNFIEFGLFSVAMVSVTLYRISNLCFLQLRCALCAMLSATLYKANCRHLGLVGIWGLALQHSI
jgi:hypothetical protein